MTRQMFESTVPFGEPELMRASAYNRFLDALETGIHEPGLDARISTLSMSLRADLMRFSQPGASFEAVEVLAACVRHVKRLTVHLQCGASVVPMTVFAQEQLVHCPMPLAELLEKHVATVRVLHVEPALLRPPGDHERALVAATRDHHPLPLLLWEMAMRGPRRELLPEIAGAAVYRLAPSLNLASLPASGAMLHALRRLQQQTLSLRELATQPGLDRERAARLLNALYLQAGLIVSRSHPGGLGERWFGNTRR
jgi:hypothetical protein